jgi:hemoglobin
MQIAEGSHERHLALFVSHFDSDVRANPLLGPLFSRAIVDWPTRVERLASFWSSVRHARGRYKHQPLRVRLRDQTEPSPEMFGRSLKFLGK